MPITRNEVLLGLGCCVAAACRHAPVLPTGSSSFAFVEPAPTAPLRSKVVTSLADDAAHEFANPAEAIEPLANPLYPPAALAGQAGEARVAVRLLVDREGRVVAVEQSWRAITLAGAWESEFRSAVETAVRQWRFRPAQLELIRRVQRPDGGFDNRVLRTEPIDWSLEVVFRFTQTGGVVKEP